MKKRVWITSLVLCISLMLLLAGCGKKEASTATSSEKVETESYNNIEETTLSDLECKWYEYTEPISEVTSYIVPEGVEFPYYIKVNRIENCVTVYGIDDKGEYSVPVKAFACSTGRAGNETIMGDFNTSDYYPWCYMVDGSYGCYAIRFKNGYMFHAVPSYSAKCGDLEDGEYNKLGDFASLGCVRMRVSDVKWIYDNCKRGTGVTVYDEAGNPGPLGKPDTIKLPTEGDKKGWDPTDPDEANPWKNESAKIIGARDIATKVGEEINIMEGVSATDTCGNDITSKIGVVGRYTFDKKGTYEIKYYVVDAIGSRAEVSVTLKVE